MWTTPPASLQHVELLVVEIAGVIAQCPHAGMGRHHGGARQAGRLQHGALGDMRHIDQHAEPVELRDRGAAEFAEPAMLLREVAQIGARIGGIGQFVVAVMGEGQVARAEFAQARQPAEIGADRVAVLDGRHDGGGTVAPGGLDLVGGNGNAGVRPAHGADGLQHGDGAGEGGLMAGGIPPSLRDIGRETAGGEAAAPHLGQVDAALGLRERVGSVRPGDVDMGVEGQQFAVQGFAGRRGGFVHAVTIRLPAVASSYLCLARRKRPNACRVASEA